MKRSHEAKRNHGDNQSSKATNQQDTQPETRSRETISVHLKGFRSHQDSTYEFPITGSTCIRGPNGAGKSDIYRAIRWALFPKKGENVHPLGTSSKVEVTFKIPGIVTVHRTGTPNTISVKVGKKTMTGEDADQLLNDMFGGKKTWGLCSHLDSNKHPFVAATGPQKIEMINQIIGGDEAIKATITSKLSLAKSEMTAAFSVYDKRKTQHIAIHGSNFSSIGKNILSDKDLKKTTKTIEELTATITSQEKDLIKLSTFKARESDLVKLTSGTKYTDAELKNLSDKKAAYDKYSSKLRTYKSLLSGYPGIEPCVYSDEEIHQVAISTKVYEDNLKECKRLQVPYKEEAVKNLIAECQQQVDNASTLKAISEYGKLATSLKDALHDAGGGDVQSKLDRLTLELSQLEENLKYTNLFESYKKVETLTQQLNEYSSKLDTAPTNEYISYLTKSIDSRSIIDARSVYERESMSLCSSIVDKHTIVEEISSIKQQLKEIELSKVAKCCPHCSGLVSIVKDTIVKFEGKVVSGDSIFLKTRVASLERLSSMKYPDLPIGDINTTDSIASMREKISIANKVIQLRATIKEYSVLETLPTTVQYVSRSQGESEQKKLKKAIDYCNAALQAQSKLLAFGECPVLPQKLTSHAYPLTIISSANKIVFVDKQDKDPKYMRACTMLHAAKVDLDTYVSSCYSVDKVEEITEKQVLAYASKLGIYKSALVELAALKKDKAKITVTKDDVESNKASLNELLASMKAHNKDLKTQESYKELKKVKSLYTRSKKRYDEVVELKDIIETELKQLMIGFVDGIENDVNAFLKTMESSISINIIYTDKIKLVCYKDSVEVGKPDQLSCGEQSLLSFAISVAFSLQSPSSILILDEITDKLSPENKDKAIELLLETLEGSNKCLMITDHNCHCGDYNKVIDICERIEQDDDSSSS
jgi:energy-coupling factor transporter ATP-binding protein EcfA2